MSTRRQLLTREKPQVRSTMPVIIRDTPPGHDWGWYSREDPRMHLQVVSGPHRIPGYKVWLETRGRRTIEPVGKIPPRVLKALTTTIHANRRGIEDHWVEFMIRKGWLEVHLAAPRVTLIAYPNTPSRFARTIDLTQDLLPEEARVLRPEDLRLSPEMASLQIWPWKPEDKRQDIRLSTILWQGKAS